MFCHHEEAFLVPGSFPLTMLVSNEMTQRWMLGISLKVKRKNLSKTSGVSSQVVSFCWKVSEPRSGICHFYENLTEAGIPSGIVENGALMHFRRLQELILP